ncbi:MAG: hypothetical protein V1726_01855 [Methanobacteriota archaeon]
MLSQKKFIFQSTPKEEITVTPTIKISTVTTTQDFKEFYRVPWQIYKSDPYWIPPLWRELKDFFTSTNPFWRHGQAQLYIAYENNVPVGRIVAIIDQLFIEKEKKPIGYFGFFECCNQYPIATALFQAAETWLKSKKITTIRGPINGRIDIGCGFLYQGFDSSPSILETYSPAYYTEYAETYGFQKCKDLVSYYLDLTNPIPPKVEETAKQVEKKGIQIRGFHRLRSRQEIDWWIPLMMQEFANHWGYVPVSEEEVRTRFGIKQARWFVDSKLFLIAEAQGEPISFKWSTPDYNQVFKTLNGKLGLVGTLKFFFRKHTITRGTFNFVGIKKLYRSQGIGTFMNYYTMLEMKRRGYTGAECGWIDEENIASRRAIEKIGAKLVKIFRVYEKTIE